jgi:hypothetical protein
LPAEPTTHHTVALVAKRVPHGIVCLVSALSIHEIGTQVPHEVWLAVDRKARKPELGISPSGSSGFQPGPWNTASTAGASRVSEAQANTLHAPKVRPVVDEAPRQQAVEAARKGQLADPDAGLVVADRPLGLSLEREVAEVSVGVQASEIGLAEPHEDGMCRRAVTAVLELVGFDDRVRIRIVGIVSRQDLLITTSEPGSTSSGGYCGNGPWFRRSRTRGAVPQS